MALKIKDSINIDNSKISTEIDNEVFAKFKLNLEKSWRNKNKEIEKAESQSEVIERADYNISYTPDMLKQRSLITYIDAPWGSGKTHFIESFLSWVSTNNIRDFELGKGPTEVDIDVIDAWEVYNGKNINEVLYSIFKIDAFEKTLKKKVIKEKEKLSKEKKGSEYIESSRNKFNRIADITEAASKVLLPIAPVVPVLIKGGRKVTNIVLENKLEFNKQFENAYKNMGGAAYDDHISKYALANVLHKHLNEQFENNEKIIFIDNIERLSKVNRLDVINKILNWANIQGVTYIFLTNFDKIDFDMGNEEDFWNKISLHETFKLSNSWEKYLETYKTDKLDLTDNNNALLLAFIKEIIPNFFTGNKDNMDIREIKKLLDNWDIEDGKRLNPGELITSFIKEMIGSNLKGLDKYFFINKVLTIISEDRSKNNYWKEIWEEDFINELFNNDKQEYESKKDGISELGMFNNKMMRIQSNFFQLRLKKDKNNKITIVENSMVLSNTDKISFMEFNNFKDEASTQLFLDLFKDISKTREINDESNYLYKYMELMEDGEELNYFEFKYNSLPKIYLYNKIISKVLKNQEEE